MRTRTLARVPHHAEGTDECYECAGDYQVVLPERLVEACAAQRLVLFVGSGASTESHKVMPHTFYDEVAADLGTLPAEDRAFPDLMQAYVERHSRSDLIVKFFLRLQYINKFWDLKRHAIGFYEAVAAIPYLRNIITTNWDNYFETVAGAVPLVSGADFDYWDLPVRKVLKIHGSMLNPGTIVATRTEYDASLDALRTGALGVAARHLISTSAVAFVGYSYRDEDVRDVVDALRADLGRAARDVYFVNPAKGFEPPIAGATVLRTSAVAFVEQLDDALVDRELLHPLTMYDRIVELHDKANLRRQVCVDRLPEMQFPLSIYNHAYQDGVCHACQRLESSMTLGDDRAPGHLNHIAQEYERRSHAARRARDYWNYSYYEGYLTGLIAALALDVPLNQVPVYFCPGIEHETSFERVARAIRAGSATHLTAHRWARRIVDRQGPGMVSNHTPFA